MGDGVPVRSLSLSLSQAREQFRLNLEQNQWLPRVERNGRSRRLPLGKSAARGGPCTRDWLPRARLQVGSALQVWQTSRFYSIHASHRSLTRLASYMRYWHVKAARSKGAGATLHFFSLCHPHIAAGRTQVSRDKVSPL
ncbi:hypothetical protein KC361_g255 [Hortaea werneckii]|nr:hypothetical protein KC361_g255 [Hortaea werneckii]